MPRPSKLTPAALDWIVEQITAQRPNIKIVREAVERFSISERNAQRWIGKAYDSLSTYAPADRLRKKSAIERGHQLIYGLMMSVLADKSASNTQKFAAVDKADRALDRMARLNGAYDDKLVLEPDVDKLKAMAGMDPRARTSVDRRRRLKELMDKAREQQGKGGVIDTVATEAEAIEVEADDQDIETVPDPSNATDEIEDGDEEPPAAGALLVLKQPVGGAASS